MGRGLGVPARCVCAPGGKSDAGSPWPISRIWLTPFLFYFNRFAIVFPRPISPRSSARGLAVDAASGDVGLLVHRLLGSVCGCSAGDCPGPCGQMLFVLFEGGDLTAESRTPLSSSGLVRMACRLAGAGGGMIPSSKRSDAVGWSGDGVVVVPLTLFPPPTPLGTEQSLTLEP